MPGYPRKPPTNMSKTGDLGLFQGPPPPSPNLGLERYLPLGSFVFQPVDSAIISSVGDEWIELKHDSLPFPKTEFHSHVVKLFRTGWARLFIGRNDDDQHATVRVYLLPDDVAQSQFPRTMKSARSALRHVMSVVDPSTSAWMGHGSPSPPVAGYKSCCEENDSLFYIFNTLKSPRPDYNAVMDPYVIDAMKDILENSLIEKGLQTQLYSYQRRSAAMMLQRESCPMRRLDPRLETFQGPTSQRFYFDREACHVLDCPRSYDEARGGILGETMGYGKTLICLSAILATKDHCPEIPPEYSTNFETYEHASGCRSLALMATDTALRSNAPWRVFFREHALKGEYFENCVRMLESTMAGYWIDLPQGSRRGSVQKKERVFLAPTTLVIIPPNLFSQWQTEVKLHLDEDALSILIVNEEDNILPSGAQLARYDMILMTRTRFEEETNGKATDYDSGKFSRCRCETVARRCQVHVYRSPLVDVHFLRLIVDEGHGFVSSGSKTRAIKGLNSIKVERKWIVSGTPATGLIGVEVDLAAEENATATTSSDEDLIERISRPDSPNIVDNTADSLSAVSQSRRRSDAKASLADRQQVIAFEQERNDIERLGHIVKSFLGVKPWSNSQSYDPANWNSYVLPSRTGERKSLSLRNVLEGLVVRHRIEDVEADLQLPPLYNKTVRLQPCFFDKLSINLFLLVLTANAVTSERTDQDYMYHPKNRKSLEALIKNLRHSSFFWTGFSDHDISESCRASREYLEDPKHFVTDDDRSSLESVMSIAQIALRSPAWLALGQKNEIGMYVEGFPKEVVSTWALSEETTQSPLLIGASQLDAVKNLVEANLYATDPLACLNKKNSSDSISSAPIMNQISNLMHESPKKRGQADDLPTNRGIPKSSLQDSMRLTGGQFATRIKRPKTGVVNTMPISEKKQQSSITPSTKSALKGDLASKPEIPQAYKHLAQTKLVGTSSAKLSYLLDKITELEQKEKILVFYEGDDIAYYCAQCLEILGIGHLIYASGITLKLRTEYQALFNEDETYRVMLMDLKQAAHGLHMASASRVFFINPVWQPNIEAQAIKRAHRIGQTRPVYVETLVLAETLEEAMLQRRKAMSSEEHQKASKSLLDDAAINEMIKSAKPIALTAEEKLNEKRQYAALQTGQQVFGRSIVAAYGSPEELASAILSSAAKTSPERPASPKKRKAMFADEVDLAIVHGKPARESTRYHTPGGSSAPPEQGIRFAAQEEHLVARASSGNAGCSPSHADGDAHAAPTKKRRAMFADEVDGPLIVAISEP